jgi:acyl-CoA thioester hydrolase
MGRGAEGATSPASYRHWTAEHVRFADLDPLGHVNNNAFGVYFEQGRVGFARESRLLEGRPGIGTVLARFAADYLAELGHPAGIAVGTRILSVGRSSFVFGQGVFAGERCFAVAESVTVLFDLATRRPVALDPAQRRLLEAWMESFSGAR